MAAVDRVASQLPDPSPPDGESSDAERETLEESRADALSLMCSARLARDPDPDRACVVVHAQYESLLDDGANAVIVGGPAIHSRTAQRPACDGHLEVVLYDDDGDEIGIGRAAREPTAWLRRQVRRRDAQTCVFPGCEMRSFLHTHYIHWRNFGGRMDLNKLITVCTFHHKLVHEHGWRVELHDSTPVWFRPDGRRLDLGPAPPVETTGPPRSPGPIDNLPWPAFWHALQGDDYEFTKDASTSWLLRFGGAVREVQRWRGARRAGKRCRSGSHVLCRLCSCITKRTNAGATVLARLGTAPGIGMNRHPNAAERRLCFPGIVY